MRVERIREMGRGVPYYELIISWLEEGSQTFAVKKEMTIYYTGVYPIHIGGDNFPFDLNSKFLSDLIKHAIACYRSKPKILKIYGEFKLVRA
jgi:hypothetical protein